MLSEHTLDPFKGIYTFHLETGLAGGIYRRYLPPVNTGIDNTPKSGIYQGRPQDLAGGGQEFFFRFGNLHVAKRHDAHGEAMRFARGCNLVRFGVYFDQILSFKKFKKLPFFYIKNLKIAIFYIEE